ncbi:MAG TPA: aminotransferase class V-fold PLP-dependent enzyme [Thermomicrobiales bacterium]|nr:aminotransferase class V-fold PLP-dependent enzyme [Thermomicrobiales bacterium]
MATETSTAAATAADREKVRAIREELPAVHERAYLNTGTNGPLPRRAHRALVEYALAELEEGRIGPATRARMGDTQTAAREGVAHVLGCDPTEVALTHNTTEGMNIALMGLDWRPGDELVTSRTEHPGGLYPSYLIKQRHGAKIRMTRIGLKDVDPVEELRAALTPRTKAVVLSHVAWSTGMVLPLRELADLAHEVGALLICDAAQGFAHVPSRVYDLGVDAYACSGQKWACGPDGTGALFVRRDRLGDIRQTYMGYAGVRPGMSDHDGHYVPGEGTRRYEAATLYGPSVRGFAASLGWIAEEVGWDWAYARAAALGRRCYELLAAIEGVTMHTPPDRMAGLVHFALDGIAPSDLSAKLNERGISIRYTPYPSANRVSTGFYNTEEEVDRLAEQVKAIRRSL